MLIVRLQRVGRKNDPSFRVVLVEKARSTKTGRVLEVLGAYNAKAGQISLKGDRISHWISKGAQTSGTIHNFLIDHKIITGKKINVLPKKTVPKKEGEAVVDAATPAAEAAPQAEAPAGETNSQ